jgi:hypothetical protein
MLWRDGDMLTGEAGVLDGRQGEHDVLHEVRIGIICATMMVG